MALAFSKNNILRLDKISLFKFKKILFSLAIKNSKLTFYPMNVHGLGPIFCFV